MTTHADLMFKPQYVKAVKSADGSFCLTTHAFSQLQAAYEDYKPGVPVDYGNKSFLMANSESMFGSKGTTTMQTIGSTKMITTTLPGGQEIPQMIGPPSDEELGLEPLHAMHLCAMCGRDKKPNGRPLRICSGCKDRFYCGQPCQKKGWKYHKIVCQRPAEEMKAFLESIPVEWIVSEEGESDMPELVTA